MRRLVITNFFFFVYRVYENSGTVFHSANSKIKIPIVCIHSDVSPSLLSISNLNIDFEPMINSYTQVYFLTVKTF